MTELIGEMMFGREGLSVRNGFFFFQYSERFMDGSISQRVLDFGQQDHQNCEFSHAANIVVIKKSLIM